MTYTQVFRLPDVDNRVRQGEILSNFRLFVPQFVEGEQPPPIRIDVFPFVVVVTPDCDIETYERNLSAGKGSTMNGFSLLPLEDRSTLQPRTWNDAKRNARTATHVLEICAAEFDHAAAGLPALYAEFRWAFSVDPEFLKASIVEGQVKRRTQLCSPYRDHLQSRYAAHLARVALERDHDTD